jgi:isoleucyl-tRNA synthetase
VYRAIYDFASVDLSSIYFDVLKDRLYTGAPAGQPRRSAQTALDRLNSALARLLAPILSFTCEEVWRNMVHTDGAESSVHIVLFPEPGFLASGLTDAQRAVAADWEQLVPVRETVLKALDGAREDKLIGSSLEAAVILEAGPDNMDLLTKYAAELPGWFIVSQVHVASSPEAGLRLKVERARGEKCERCWKYTEDVGSDPRFPTVCASCASILPDFLK